MRPGGIFATCIALAAAPLGGCGFARSINGGAFALPTAGGHLPVGGVVSGHLAVGDEKYLGVDATLRATGDYGSLAVGGHVAGITNSGPTGLYARLGFAPLALSLRDDTVWYAFDGSLEGGLQFAERDVDTRGPLGSTFRAHTAWTLGVRGDVEYRPGQAQADVFISLVFGFMGVEGGGIRGF